jgi:hypothetical protein
MCGVRGVALALLRCEQREAFEPRSLSVFTLGREGIAEITTFIGAELPLGVGLPDELQTKRPPRSRFARQAHPTRTA